MSHPHVQRCNPARRGRRGWLAWNALVSLALEPSQTQPTPSPTPHSALGQMLAVGRASSRTDTNKQISSRGLFLASTSPDVRGGGKRVPTLVCWGRFGVGLV